MLSAEEGDSACKKKKTKTTEEIPGHVTEVMLSNPVILETVKSPLPLRHQDGGPGVQDLVVGNREV